MNMCVCLERTFWNISAGWWWTSSQILTQVPSLSSACFDFILSLSGAIVDHSALSSYRSPSCIVPQLKWSDKQCSCSFSLIRSCRRPNSEGTWHGLHESADRSEYKSFANVSVNKLNFNFIPNKLQSQISLRRDCSSFLSLWSYLEIETNVSDFSEPFLCAYIHM